MMDTPGKGIARVLCLGDVVGKPGRQALKDRLPGLRKKLGLSMVIANGENSAGGIGITAQTLDELIQSGVDMVTTGNHVWKHREFYPHLNKNLQVIRPENQAEGLPGRGMAVHTVSGFGPVAVLNLAGRSFMDPADCPFKAAERLLAALSPEVKIRIVDFHAEATSEKRAMAHFLDGRVSAVVGTHTHVQTADAMISPLGTASLTDLGMCGVEENSVIGMAKEAVLGRFITGLPHPFKPARGAAALNGAVIDIDSQSGKALAISLLRDNPAQILPSLLA